MTSVVPPAMVAARLCSSSSAASTSSPAITSMPARSARSSATSCPNFDHESLMSDATAPGPSDATSASARSPIQPRIFDRL